jgi:hypothetical protein
LYRNFVLCIFGRRPTQIDFISREAFGARLVKTDNACRLALGITFGDEKARHAKGGIHLGGQVLLNPLSEAACFGALKDQSGRNLLPLKSGQHFLEKFA